MNFTKKRASGKYNISASRFSLPADFFKSSSLKYPALFVLTFDNDLYKLNQIIRWPFFIDGLLFINTTTRILGQIKKHKKRSVLWQKVL
jgi:hypothetical protein